MISKMIVLTNSFIRLFIHSQHLSLPDTVCFSVFLFIVCLTPRLLHEGRGFCLLCSLLYPCHLQEGVTDSRSLHLSVSWKKAEDCMLEKGEVPREGGQFDESIAVFLKL